MTHLSQWQLLPHISWLFIPCFLERLWCLLVWISWLRHFLLCKLGFVFLLWLVWQLEMAWSYYRGLFKVLVGLYFGTLGRVWGFHQRWWDRFWQLTFYTDCCYYYQKMVMCLSLQPWESFSFSIGGSWAVRKWLLIHKRTKDTSSSLNRHSF